jgi:dihydrodipicolinate synthase/N-acetylneuraminate lyase
MSGQYRGIFAAMQLPFKPDLSIDEPELRSSVARV